MADLDFDSLYVEVVKPTAKKTSKPVEAKPAEAKPAEVKADVITRAARPVQRSSGATMPSKPPPPAETFTPEMYDQAMDAFDRGAQQGRDQYRDERSLPRQMATIAARPVRAAMATLPPVRDVEARGEAMRNPDAFPPNEVEAKEKAERENRPDLDLLLTAKRVPRTNLVERAAAPPASTVIDMSGDTVKENGKPMKGKSAKQRLLAAGMSAEKVNAATEEEAAMVAEELSL